MPIQHVVTRLKTDATIRASRLTWSQLFDRRVRLAFRATRGNVSKLELAEFEAVKDEMTKRREIKEAKFNAL